MKILAKTFAGLEELLAKEIEDLGGENVQVSNRAVTFEGTHEVLYKVNIWSRLALRFLRLIDEFKITKGKDVYDGIMKTDWWKMIGVDDSFRIDNTIFSDHFDNPLYAVHLTKDAIVDQFRSRFNKRPRVQKEDPDFIIQVTIKNDLVLVYQDSTGEALFKRGYRIKAAEAPINEILAAGMIMHSGWDMKMPLVDPMCGAGTIPVEAALMAMNIPPAFLRKRFAFMNWHDFERITYNKVKSQIFSHQRDPETEIYGFDISERNLDIAKFNIQSIKFHKDITLGHSSFFDLKPPAEEGMLIMNPPYGERLNLRNAKQMYEDIGNTLKQNWSGYQAWIISSDHKAMHSVGLRPSKKLQLFNGKLECKFHAYDLFKGSWKEKKTSENSED